MDAHELRTTTLRVAGDVGFQVGRAGQAGDKVSMPAPGASSDSVLEPLLSRAREALVSWSHGSGEGSEALFLLTFPHRCPSLAEPLRTRLSPDILQPLAALLREQSESLAAAALKAPAWTTWLPSARRLVRDGYLEDQIEGVFDDVEVAEVVASEGDLFEELEQMRWLVRAREEPLLPRHTSERLRKIVADAESLVRDEVWVFFPLLPRIEATVEAYSGEASHAVRDHLSLHRDIIDAYRSIAEPNAEDLARQLESLRQEFDRARRGEREP